jgi:hypothetical protein
LLEILRRTVSNQKYQLLLLLWHDAGTMKDRNRSGEEQTLPVVGATE